MEWFIRMLLGTSSKSTFPIKWHKYRGADKSLVRPGRTKAAATEDFEFHISYL